MAERVQVSDLVHYVSHGSPVRPDGTQEFGSVCRAAVVAAADDPAGVVVELCVLNPTGIFFHSSRRDSDHAPGTWHGKEMCGG